MFKYIYLKNKHKHFLKYKKLKMGDILGLVKSMFANVSLNKLFNLATGVVGIYLTYTLTGLFHEKMLKFPYYNYKTGLTSERDDTFTFSIGFLIFPTGFAWLIGNLINRLNSQKTYMPQKNLIKCASMVVISTMTYTVAIYYTNFPIVMMFKSCNLISIIMVALLCSKVKSKSLKLGKSKLIVGLIITFGIILFNFSGDKSQEAKKQQGNLLIGLPLLIVSFIADGFLPDFQAQIKDKYKPRPLQMFEKINKWVCLISLLYSVLALQLIDILTYMWYHPMFSIHMGIMSTLSTIGQMFVYRMLTHFKQHIVPFVITTRKIFTVLFSIIYYGHKSTDAQFVAIAIVFFAVTIEFIVEMNKKAGGEIEIKNQERPLQDFSVSVQPKLQEPQTAQHEEDQKH